jgi:hypothetical protein
MEDSGRTKLYHNVGNHWTCSQAGPRNCVRCTGTDLLTGRPEELLAMSRDGLAHRPPRGTACDAQGRTCSQAAPRNCVRCTGTGASPRNCVRCTETGTGPRKCVRCTRKGAGPKKCMRCARTSQGSACDAQGPCTSHGRKFIEKCRAMRRGRAHRKNVLQALFFGDVIISAFTNQRNSLFFKCVRAVHIARPSLAEGGPRDARLFGSLWTPQK